MKMTSFKTHLLVLVMLLVIVAGCRKNHDNRTPEVAVTSIKITKPQSEAIKIGETLQLTAEILPTTATNKEITWSSSKPDVATVTSAGVVKGIKVGATEIIATAGSKSDKVTLQILYPNKVENGVVDFFNANPGALGSDLKALVGDKTFNTIRVHGDITGRDVAAISCLEGLIEVDLGDTNVVPDMGIDNTKLQTEHRIRGWDKDVFGEIHNGDKKGAWYNESADPTTFPSAFIRDKIQEKGMGGEKDKSSLKRFVFPRTVKEIKSHSLFSFRSSELSNLEEVVLPDNLERLSGEYIFKNCGKLSKITFPKTLTIIGSGPYTTELFMNQETWQMEPRPVPEYYRSEAFYGCEQLSDILTRLPADIKVIGRGAFLDIVPSTLDFSRFNNLKVISESLFLSTEDYDIDIKTPIVLTLPKGVKEIRHTAFKGHHIKKVVLPETVTYISGGAFTAPETTGMTIEFTSKQPPKFAVLNFIDEPVWDYYFGSISNKDNVTLIVPKGQKSLYEAIQIGIAQDWDYEKNKEVTVKKYLPDVVGKIVEKGSEGE
ncbi:leucine-rich repeat protein [Porphyromonas somerae]|uniref:leucine-rich repeat protein n=1 Tax=Porphyromonas somerae TaxID=322095 RepID=UPI001FCA8E8C|nr:leucine-rich repeat protein [Porphyromonas somerae]